MGRKSLYLIAASVLIGLMIPCVTSCDGEPDDQTVTTSSGGQPVDYAAATSFIAESDDYLVQVWQPAADGDEPEALLAYGVVVDDGNHVLTVLDYEEDAPDRLLVISKYGQFDASIQAADYRTSATLLQLQGANLPAAETGDASSLESNQEVTIRGWAGSDYEYMITPLDTYISDELSPLFFSVSLSEEFIYGYVGESWVRKSGAVITDSDGRVIGLLGGYGNRLLMVTRSPYYMPLAISIGGAMELLTDSSHAIGPVDAIILTENCSSVFMPTTGSSFLPQIEDIESLNTAIMVMLDDLGESLPLEDLSQYTSRLPTGFHPEEGIMLIAAFTYPVELHDGNGNLLASAKWIGIQWNRFEDKPDRLIYGSKTYEIDGVYSIDVNFETEDSIK